MGESVKQKMRFCRFGPDLSCFGLYIWLRFGFKLYFTQHFSSPWKHSTVVSRRLPRNINGRVMSTFSLVFDPYILNGLSDALLE